MVKANKLSRSYLVYQVNHTVLLVDTSSVGLPNEIFPPEGKEYNLPSLRFQSWQGAEKYLLERGASRNDLDKTRVSLSKTSVALLINLGVIVFKHEAELKLAPTKLREKEGGTYLSTTAKAS